MAKELSPIGSRPGIGPQARDTRDRILSSVDRACAEESRYSARFRLGIVPRLVEVYEATAGVVLT